MRIKSKYHELGFFLLIVLPNQHHCVICWVFALATSLLGSWGGNVTDRRTDWENNRVWVVAPTSLFCSFLPHSPLFHSRWCHFLFPVSWSRSSLSAHCWVTKSPPPWHSCPLTFIPSLLVLPCSSYPSLPSLSCSVCCANCAVILFPVLVIVARAEECIWRSYPSCPRATWDAEKQEMLYILNSATALITSSVDFHYSLHFSFLHHIALFFLLYFFTSAAFEIWIHLNFNHLNNHQLATSVTPEPQDSYMLSSLQLTFLSWPILLNCGLLCVSVTLLVAFSNP